MKKMISTFCFVLISAITVAQETAIPYNRYFTWNPDSTIVYSKPDNASEKVVKLNYGTEVSILSEQTNAPAQFKVETSVEFEGDYFLNGYWLAIESEGSRGYVFSGEVINFPPHIRTSSGTFSRTAEAYNAFGWDPKVDKKKIPVKLTDNTYFKYEETTLFPDGSSVLDRSALGCFDHRYYFEGKNLNQMYFILKTKYATQSGQMKANEYYFPKLAKATNTQLDFEDGPTAARKVRIEIKKDGKLYIASFDCD
ncbi:SH3 domain-containing protein [Roseivirga echinicomitans]